MLPFRRGATWQTLFLLCALAYCINVASGEGRVVCYYTNWSVYRPGTAKFNPQNINPYLCTHLVYAFGGFTKDNQMKPFDKYQDIEQGGYAKFTGLKTYNKQLKTMIAIGGWNEASSRFSPLVASADRRQQFIKNILKFLRQNHFDGIDLDWEYPAHREGGKPRDRDNYAQFVQELRAEFEREAEKTGRSRLLLTMAVPAGIEYIDKGYDVPKLNKYLDWFNVLTYDFHSSHEPSVNHHAPLYSLEDDSEYNYDAELNIDYSIKYYLKAGADRDKLVLGIPTYGRSYTLINEESTELGAPSEGPGEQGDATREKGYLAYYEICQTLKEDSEWTVVQPNPNVMGPYAYRRNQWVGYDDEAIVRKKAEYVVAHGLGGIMFWAIDNDDFRGTCTGKPYPLIEAAKEAMFDAYGLGINEVAKSVGPQKPLRSRSRENGITSTRKHLNSESESSSRGSSAARRPGSRGSTTTTPATTTIRLTEPKGSSLYIGGRGSTTPAPPTTPDPGSDFKCEEEGFFQHPRDCKKYYWCLDSGPSGLGIVAHQFTCPSGLYFNPAADSCDFARNVPCKTKKSTTAAPVTSTSTTTTTTPRPTSRYNRVTAAPVARPVYPRVTSTTTTTTAAPVEDELEYEEDGDNTQTSNKSSDAEEDPQVIKELIDLIRKVGGIEQLEKHLLRNKDGSITLKENFSNGAPTTPSTISKSLYDRVLSRPETLGTFSRNRFSAAKVQTTESSVADDSSSQAGNSKYSSVLRGNSRQGPQNEGLEKLPEFDGFLKERKQYVTINRNRGVSRDDEEREVSSKDDPEASEEEEAEQKSEQIFTTRRPISSATPSYTSLRRSRPTTTTSGTPVDSVTESEQTFAVREQTQTKQYATLNRNRGRSTERPQSIVSEPEVSSITNRYKYLERTRPTKSSADASVGIDDASEHDAEEDEDEYEDEPQQKNNRYQVSRTRGTTTTTTPRATASTTAATANTRRLSFGSRSRAQVTKLSIVGDESSDDEDDDDDDEADATETTTVAPTVTTAATPSTKPTLKRIRVLKYRRPLQSIDSSNSTSTSTTNTNTNTTNSASTTHTENITDTITLANNTTKRFRKIVRKLRPVQIASDSNRSSDGEQSGVVGESTTTTRKPFQPSRSRFGAESHSEQVHDEGEDGKDKEADRHPLDLQRLRNRLKTQQARGEPEDGVLSSRLQGSEEETESEGNSALQQLRDKVKAEQARGTGEQGVINDKLKKLLVEKATASQGDSNAIIDDDEKISSTTAKSALRPAFRRKLVAKRPYVPSTSNVPTKAPLSLNSTRPTAKFVRRKNGRFDPFNSSVRNKGEGFVRNDPRGSRLPGTDRFKQQETEGEEDDDEANDDEEYEKQQEHPPALVRTSLLGSQAAVRKPFTPKSKQPKADCNSDNSEDEYDEDDDGDDDDEEEEENEQDDEQHQTVSNQEQGDSTNKPQTPAYRAKDNRVLPGSRPSFSPTGSGGSPIGGNVPFNPRNRQPNSSQSTPSAPSNRFGGSNRPRVINRPPGVATPNLTLRPVAKNYERTTPLTPLKPAPFIPSSNRSYERKYTGPSTEAPETASENPLIEDLNIDALNARNKKIFDINSKKHTTLKPKVAPKAESDLESGTETALERDEDSDEQQQQNQGYVTTTPTTPTTNPTSTQSTDTTNTETEPENENDNETAQPPIVHHVPMYANEATNISSLPQDKETATLSLTTQSPPPATTLLHVFTLVEGEAEEDQEPTGRPLGSKITAVEPKHKLIEINRIVEINSKQAKAAHRKSKANQDFVTLRVESLPHVEQLGEISVVKYVHLVDGSDIQINDGHSTVADYTPTEPSTPSKNSAPVRNSLPQTEGDSESERNGKALLPEVIRSAYETSTISLEGLFDSERKAKQLNLNSIDKESNTERSLNVELDAINNTEPPTALPALAAALPTVQYVRPIVPLLRPESNESSPLIISIANLDKVILSKVQTPEGESDASASASAAAATGIDDSSSTLLPPTSSSSSPTQTAADTVSDSNSAFSVRHASVLQAPFHDRLADPHRQTIDNTLTNGAISGTDYNSNNMNNSNINNSNIHTTLTNSSRISKKISYSSETHVVRRKKSRRGRGQRKRERHNNTTTTTTTATIETPTTLAP
ncbi:LOW QUALITY PROTEIN: uncharacterized protein Dmoj_GI16000 [Drosophila mojavensis]|uniref:chitinase n=1 Tax=Drosophila mojavensis TaxID=7230 RepID=B4L2Z8_DROMO|nr:LOW QUALITY PROTEIN: uncharacterized protein Dmoj_GI16000 [Drosophila mojavensis]